MLLLFIILASPSSNQFILNYPLTGIVHLMLFSFLPITVTSYVQLQIRFPDLGNLCEILL